METKKKTPMNAYSRLEWARSAAREDGCIMYPSMRGAFLGAFSRRFFTTPPPLARSGFLTYPEGREKHFSKWTRGKFTTDPVPPSKVAPPQNIYI